MRSPPSSFPLRLLECGQINICKLSHPYNPLLLLLLEPLPLQILNHHQATLIILGPQLLPPLSPLMVNKLIQPLLELLMLMETKSLNKPQRMVRFSKPPSPQPQTQLEAKLQLNQLMMMTKPSLNGWIT